MREIKLARTIPPGLYIFVFLFLILISIVFSSDQFFFPTMAQLKPGGHPTSTTIRLKKLVDEQNEF